MKSVFTFCILLINIACFAQNGDCIKAISICKKDSFSFTFSNGVVKNEVTPTNAPCFGPAAGITDVESASSWIKWRAATTGTLTFTITPTLATEDIDFVVYRIANDTCGNKTAVRCMASGSTPGFCSLSGPTGLREGETDISEPTGCASLQTQNNFLAPLSMQAGERYVLFINNYSNTNTTARISFGGTATFACETATVEKLDSGKITIFPNPAKNELYLEVEGCALNNLHIFNHLGQTIYVENIENQQDGVYKVSIADLPKGYYLIMAKTKEGKNLVQRFVKN